MANQKIGGSNKKKGRSKRKAEGRVKPLSQFVRGKITAENYFSQTGQTVKRKQFSIIIHASHGICETVIKLMLIGCLTVERQG